ncbi:MAG: NADH-quinone oxidoreductase subunit M [Nitrospirae bacterium GWF2_44_13]|nr:MAG: NADH-quinone oxidoreductase subunit M [Nitrospirae bacterium GWF2_44_13]OGW34715.1 MAG: NADH-quinone oxidoreductase subunit M [Nitrospirae bacterium GWD2_44_7]OGW63308.1 MAG: NADH-quinone oxidoreductase subunit M [Nitrospirae bacterium RIFOXYA2_FULL_44_9]
MNNLGFPILSTLIFLPVAGAALLLLISRSNENLIKWFSLIVSIAAFIISIPLFAEFNKSTHLMQFTEKHAWIPSLNINYHLGIDGISVLFVLLSTLITILCVLISWNSIKAKTKEFYISILIMEGAMIGVFCSLDFMLFYLFWEAMLIPMYLLIGVWGGTNRIYAAVKFFLFTLVGSVLMLVGIIVLYYQAGGTFDILELTTKTYPYKLQLWLFWAFFAAFAVKVPMFPVHTWLPDAHTEAPTAGSVILAAVLIKMGAYGFIRFSLPLFPDASKAMTPAMLTLSVIAIIYGAVICLAQTDLKRLIAYSSVSHMGFVTLGIFALNLQGMEGGILQMINHGVVTGALFLSVGMIYDRTHTRQIADYGGVASVMPVYASIFMVFTLASIGLPATNGFIGEFLIILGGFKANQWAGVLAATGIIIGAGYMLWLYQRVFFMETNQKVAGLADINLREIITLLPMIILVFWIGVYPNAFLGFMHESVKHLLERVNSGGMHEAGIAKNILEIIK